MKPLYTDTPIGKVRLPNHLVRKFNAMEDDELVTYLNDMRHVDPTALAVAQERGLYEWQMPNGSYTWGTREDYENREAKVLGFGGLIDNLIEGVENDDK